MADRIAFLVITLGVIIGGYFYFTSKSNDKGNYKYTVCSNTLKYNQGSNCAHSNNYTKVIGNCIKINNIIVCGNYTFSENW